MNEIKDYVLKYMRRDEFADNNGVYEVHSVYFDSPNFKAYHEKVDGVKARKKLRLRKYELKNDGDFFVEIKRKTGPVILKDRGLLKGVSLDDFNDFSSLNSVDLSKLGEEFINEFLFEYGYFNMEPKVLVSYKREPFFSKFDDNFRITFDYDLEFSSLDKVDFEKEPEHWIEDFGVMEVKFLGAVPSWFAEIVHLFALEKSTFSKYCSGAEHCYGLKSLA